MDDPEGASETGDGRLGFDRRVRLEFRGTQLSSDGGLLVMRELDDVLGLSDLASAALYRLYSKTRKFSWVMTRKLSDTLSRNFVTPKHPSR